MSPRALIPLPRPALTSPCRTPLIRIQKADDKHATILAKLEANNPLARWV